MQKEPLPGGSLRRRHLPQAIVIAPGPIKNKFPTQIQHRRSCQPMCNSLYRTPIIAKMEPPARAIRFLPRLVSLPPIGAVSPPVSCRAAAIHTSSATTAKVVPIYGTGPPPEPPAPSEAYPDARIARRKRQAEMLRQAQDLRTAKGMAAARGGKSSPLKKRFWQDVHVKEVDGKLTTCPTRVLGSLLMQLGNVQVRIKFTSTPDRSDIRIPKPSCASRSPSHTWPTPLPSSGTSSPPPSRPPCNTSSP